MKKRWLVVKHIQPTGVYKEQLSPLEHEESREILIEEPGLVIERWEFSKGEAEEVASRQHVKDVYEEGWARAIGVLPPVSVKSVSVTLEQARSFHKIPLAWEAGYKGKGAKIAVLDTGCSPELADRIGDRLVARESFAENEDWKDESGDSHGSFCLDVVAQACPDAQLVSIKVLSSKEGWGYTSWIINGIKRAVELGCTSIGMSLGGPGKPGDAMCLVVDWADSQGVLVACAAGNEQEGSTEYKADTSHPGCADRAISCAAVDSDSVLAYFSNWGTSVDISGIGVKIMQAGRSWSGTSMSTPHINAILGLLTSADKSPVEVRAALYAGARDTDSAVYQEGAGIANARGALDKLFPPDKKPPDPEPDPPFYPNVTRTSLTKYITGGYEHECVVTKRGKDLAYSVPKKV